MKTRTIAIKPISDRKAYRTGTLCNKNHPMRQCNLVDLNSQIFSALYSLDSVLYTATMEEVSIQLSDLVIAASVMCKTGIGYFIASE